MRAAGPPYPPGMLSIPTFYDSLLSAPPDDRSSKPHSATFGGISIQIGMDEQDAIDRLSTEFSVLMNEPEPAQPTTRDYQIIGETDGDNDTYRGAILVETGKVVRITESLGQFDDSDAESLITTTFAALDAAKTENETAPQVAWNTWIRDGRKNGNNELTFEFEHTTIAVVYFDSPGASQHVRITRTIGTSQWLSFPRTEDFQE